MRLFKSVNLILTLSVQPSGASIQRQICERVITCSDDIYKYFWEILLLLDFLSARLANLGHSLRQINAEIFDTLLLSWQEGLQPVIELSVKVVLTYAPLPSPCG